MSVQRFFESVRGLGSVLLESGMNGQYSIVGFEPKEVFEVWFKGDSFRIIGVSGLFSAEDVLERLYKFWLKHAWDFGAGRAGLAFSGGLIGFFSYDFGVALQGVKQNAVDDVGYPAVWFGVYDQWKVFERAGLSAQGLARRAQELPKISSNLTLDEYCAKIDQIKAYLRRGETYQINFSQRFETETDLDSWQIYKNVTALNPSPYQMYLEGDGWAVISNSPERLVRVGKIGGQGRVIESRPIKGTVARGRTLREERENRERLLVSAKDRAELTMIVDLVRNDLGQVCETGSIEVNQDRVIEEYSHVQHTVSNVRGILCEEVDFRDVIRALFPGGSISGCPKKRTLELIDKLEPFKRGVYTGSAGYIGFDGRMDFNIMIRTMFWRQSKVYFHSGGGIVIDSDAESEYQETLDKAEALIQSLY